MQPDPVTIAEFLRARLVEGHAAAIEWRENYSPQHPSLRDPEWVLADIAAKRRIVELHHVITDGTGEASCGACWKPRQLYPAAWPCETLLLLALPYAAHPEYRAEWRP